MSTGYTHDVQTGKVTEFRDFVWICARGFGALVNMRDDPSDAPIPERFEPRTEYHDKAIQKAKDDLERIMFMTDRDCEGAAQDEYKSAVEAHRKRAEEREAQRLRYKTMLAKVEAWEPPSDDHQELKNFMAGQLRQSIDFDCGGKQYDTYPERETGPEWRERHMGEANSGIEYHEDERAKEIERTKSRNKWLELLRESLR